MSCFGNREKPERICPVSKCFPLVSHLWEVSGYRCRKNEDGIEDRLVNKTPFSVMDSCCLLSVFESPFFYPRESQCSSSTWYNTSKKLVGYLGLRVKENFEILKKMISIIFLSIFNIHRSLRILNYSSQIVKKTRKFSKTNKLIFLLFFFIVLNFKVLINFESSKAYIFLLFQPS